MYVHLGICEPVDSERCKKKNDWLKCDKEQFFCKNVNDSGMYHT